MTDRELLELAAKAAGMELDYTIRPDKKAFYHSERNALALVDGGWFAPLADDGDALRLMVKLGIRVCPVTADGRNAYAAHDRLAGGVGEPHNDDPIAATRRAIVRAAAEIGRRMP